MLSSWVEVRHLSCPVLLYCCVPQTAVRVDGRGVTELRPISCQAGPLPRVVHGSGLFTRGETQSLAAATVGHDTDAPPVSTQYTAWAVSAHGTLQRHSHSLGLPGSVSSPSTFLAHGCSGCYCRLSHVVPPAVREPVESSGALPPSPALQLPALFCG